MINRRGILTGLIALVAAPAIVRAGSLMPVKAFQDTRMLAWDTYQSTWTGATFTEAQIRKILYQAWKPVLVAPAVSVGDRE